MIRKVSPLLSQSATILLILSFVLASCAPAPFKPYTPPEIKYDKLDYYEIQDKLDMIPKPEKLVPVYVVISGESIAVLSKEEKAKATHVLLAPREYAKVGGLVKLAKTYKSLTVEQEALVNTYIDQINALREMLELERQKTILYKELWVDSENAYRQEKAEHDRSNFINRAAMVVVTIGALIVVGLAL